ncbi:hypothetical protein Tco_0429814 [Tanacetum coccineum]
MSTFLKNMVGYKNNQLKNKSFDDIQKLFHKAMKRKEGSSKRAGEDLQQESIKKKKVDKDKETLELQRLIEVVPDKEEVVIDAIPLATKTSSIVDYKIHKEGKKTYYQIIRVDGSSKMYMSSIICSKDLTWKIWKPYGNWIKRLLDDLEVTAAKIHSSGINKDGIFISQDKYMEEILKKYGFTDVKTASTPMETQKPLLNDENGEEVDVHMYRSMIGSLMYLTSSRPNIMFVVCAYARYQVNLKVSHLHAMKRIFRYLKGQPKLGLWYPKDYPFDFVACTDSDYAKASLDRKSTTGGKTINEEVQLLILVDGKKIIITESTVRRDLQREDVEGVDCVTNSTIFEQLALMGPKTTAWNKFSSTMASAIICLATNQKFNFSKFIFKSMVKNLDNVGKFLMYPRFVQVFLDKQLEGMSNHNRIYVTPSHTKKIFGNIRRVGKGFSGRETPLFPTMVVHNQEEMGEGLAISTNPHHILTFNQPSPQPQKTQKSRRPKKKDTQVPQSSVPSDNVADEVVYKELNNSLVRAATTASSLEAKHDNGGGPRRQDTMGDTLLKLGLRMVLDLETTKTTQANEIASFKRRVKKLEKKDRSRTYKLKRLYKVGLSARVEFSRDKEFLGEDASKQGRIADIDADVGITLVSTHFDVDTDMFGVHDLVGDKVVVESEVDVKAGEKRNVVEEVVVVIDAASIILVSVATITDVEITLAQALAELKSAKPKANKVMIQEPEQGITTTTPTTIIHVPKPPQEKGKGIMIEEHVLQAEEEEEEEERIAREKAQQIKEANIAWDDVQAKVKADYQLAQRLQAQEQEELTDE